jgi:quinoprotein glucose dehydrogenase
MDPRTSRRSSNRAANGPLARLAGAGLAALKAPLALAALLALATACGSASRSEPAAGETIPPGDWITVNRDLAGTRYSPLEEIDAANVGALRQAWTFGLGGRGGSQAVPVAVGGVVYIPAQNEVVALDGDSGEPVWRHEAAPAPGGGRGRGGPGGGRGGGRVGGAPAGPPPAPQPSNRGLAWWAGDGDAAARIFFMAGNRLSALDAATGVPVADFGTGGHVEIGVPYNGAPTIYRNAVIVGATVGEVPQGPAGNPRAFDARTGEKLWEFQTVPRAGEPYNDQWGDGWEQRSGANMWAFSATVDAARGLVYLPIAGPAANYYGGDRPGNNDYANSIVAVDAETGEYRWHFQTVHHDLWDSDTPSAGPLLDVTVNGERVPAIAHVTKTSYMFFLDRETGEPVFGVEERPVPAGDVPGEWYSPTQPFPLRPPPLSRVSFDKDTDMVRPEDTTPEHVAACQDLWDRSGGFYNAGPFTPFRFHEDGTPPQSTIQLPGGTGGVNWGGPASDPTTGYVYVNAHDTSLVGWVEVRKPGGNYGRGVSEDVPYDRASVDGPGPYFTFGAGGMPCTRPPWARLVAVDGNTGEIAWAVPLGLSQGLPEDRQATGASGSAGPTVTAGGLVFVGATSDRRFRAFDARHGTELWSAELEASANANPMSYQGRSGKQYVAVMAGGTLVVYGLP